MPSNQNPVFTDNTTILGDGTVDNPLTDAAASSGNLVAPAIHIEATAGTLALEADEAGVTIHATSPNQTISLLADGMSLQTLDNDITIDSSNGPANININAGGDGILATAAHYNFAALQIFANNAAALAGGLTSGDLYRSGADPDGVFVVH